jgi:hypothetical protein
VITTARYSLGSTTFASPEWLRLYTSASSSCVNAAKTVAVVKNELAVLVAEVAHG